MIGKVTHSQQIQFINKNMSKLTVNQISEEIKERPISDVIKLTNKIRGRLNFQSSEIQNLLHYQYLVINKKIGFSFCGYSDLTLSASFKRAFQKLNDFQRVQYYFISLRILQDLIFTKNESKPNKLHTDISQGQVLVKEQKQFKNWTYCNIEISKSFHTLAIKSKSNTILELEGYLIRNSKHKEKRAFALESTKKENQMQTIRISKSTQSEFQKIYWQLKQIIFDALRERFSELLNSDKSKNRFSKSDKQQIKSIRVSMAMDPRSAKTVSMADGKCTNSFRELVSVQQEPICSTEDYQKISQTLVDEELFQQLDDLKSFEKIDQTTYFHSTKPIVKKVLNFVPKGENIHQIAERLFLPQKFKFWKKSLFNISMVGEVKAERTKFFHEINMYKDGTEADFVYLRHFFSRDSSLFFFDKSVSSEEYGSHLNSKSRANIVFSLWRFRPVGENIQLSVISSITNLLGFDVYQNISEQIGSLEKIISFYDQKEEEKKLQITSSFQSNNFNDYDLSEIQQNQQQSPQENAIDQPSHQSSSFSQYYSISNSQQLQGDFQNLQKQICNQKSSKKTNNVRYQLNPTIQKQNLLQQFFDGIFFDPQEIKVDNKGDVLFVNKQKNQAQGNVLKSVVKRMTKNFFTGKSILNVSLPIEIFGTDSNLERLCKSMAYAPSLLESVSSPQTAPIQRFKKVICIGFGSILLYLEMSKPFNPILGQTYQGFIDGCPIYAEQTSHHPPITSIFMKGRGYFITASLEAKVQFGLNSASGINEGFYHVAFDQNKPNKNVILFDGPPGELSGLIYGDKKLNLTKKSRYLDLSNKIYCEISWGPGKNKNSIQKFSDYIEGKIVKLKPTTNTTSIDQININKDADYILGEIAGRWTDQVYFNDELIFDANQVHPHQVRDQPYPLQSNSNFRKDIIVLKSQTLHKAQQAKEELEEIQRNDRKLRKKYS